MVAEFISNYGDVSALTILVGVMVWYFKHQTKRQSTREDKQDVERIKREEKRDKEQKEERDYYRNIISGELRKNVDLNVRGIALQTEMMKEIKDHDGQSREAWSKLNGSLGAICERFNNKTSVKDNKINGQKR